MGELNTLMPYEAGVGVKTQINTDAEAPKLVLVNRLFFDIKPS